ncbi:MAG: trypsin-like peptidase domain-containing protein [Oscillospiraceae bacterium]|nr:trypsin-like peptidase domain-containing protein [Oscillospiraceae bacterium]
MKKIKKFGLILSAVIMTMNSGTIYASAKNDASLYHQSVVRIESTITFKPSNFNIPSFVMSGYGTGFAVGKPGEKVQYVATCNHVVQESSGVYTIYVDQDGDYVAYELMPEGTAYPDKHTEIIDGEEYLVLCDYFTTSIDELDAVYSNSSNDRVSLTVAQYNKDVDVALCRLASDPTDKISALPIQFKSTVDVNTRIVAVGYASTSKFANSEERYDKSDSTLKDGIISKLQRTTGTNGSKTAYDAYEVTADLTTGMSGGPVISEETGAVVGVTAFGYTDISQAASSNYAICVDYVKELLDREGVQYKVVTGRNSVLMIVLIGAGTVFVIAIVVILLALKKKKSVNVAPPKIDDNIAADKTYIGNNQRYVNTSVPYNQHVKKYYLICTSGPLAGKKYGVTNRAVIGRDSAKCNVVFPVSHPGVSGVHCEVRVDGGTMTLRDCGSTYGTFMANGTKLTPNDPIVLQSGSSFWLGTKDNMFEVKY